ncbi:MAG: V-type ATP synthase subunit E [Candidatus Krumholzibacteriota bacterium]|nr:V-type ATP synthase subunit E [Candidatus Krumholzibacteriota bacterium]
MSIEKIFERITGDAERSAKEILDAAEQEASAVEKDYLEKAEALRTRLRSYAEKKADEEERHLIVNEQLELKKVVLRKKREILESLYEEGKKKIIGLPAEESGKILSDLILNKAISGREEIVISASQEKIFSDRFISGLNDRFEGGGKFSLSAERGEFPWGVVLREGRRVVDLSLEVIFDQLKEKIEPKIAAMLFAEK